MTRKMLRRIRRALRVAQILGMPVVFCVQGADEAIVNRAIARLARRRVDPLAVLKAGVCFPGRLMETLPAALQDPRGRIAVVGLADTLPVLLETLLLAHLDRYCVEVSALGGCGSHALGTLAATTSFSPAEIVRELRLPRAFILDLKTGEVYCFAHRPGNSGPAGYLTRVCKFSDDSDLGVA